MAFFPLSVLALAAGVYLLIKVKREYLSGGFEILAWLVILLSLVSIGFGGARALRHNSCGGDNCHIEKRIMIKDGKNCHADVNIEGHHSGLTGAKSGCARPGGCTIVGDSVVMEQATCEMMMGKEACAKMLTERGKCIVSKEECKTLCHSKGNKCCAEDTEKSCCKKM